MSENGIGDLSKIVSLIMENPKLIEEISNLAKRDDSTEVQAEEVQKGEDVAEASVPVMSTRAQTPHTASSRARLLGALKPYVSEGRANAIDSMLSIADILDMMKAR